MEGLLEGVIQSDHPEKLKKALVLRLCREAVENKDCEQELRSVLQLSTKWILHGTTPLQVSLGLKLFNTWGSQNDGIFWSFFNFPMITRLLTEDEGNLPNTPLLIKEGLQVMKSKNITGWQSHANLVNDNIVQFALCSNQEWPVLYNVSSLLLEFKMCIPLKVIDGTTLCIVYVKLLSNRVYPTQEDEIEAFIKSTDEVAKLLGHLWSHHHLSVIADSLAEVFKIISSPRLEEEDKPESAICLASLVRHVPTKMVRKFAEDVVSNSSHSDAMLEAAIGQIVEWLKWPTAQNLDLWLVCFFAGLAANHRITLLISVAEICSEQFAESIADPIQREILFRVLSEALMGFQRSPEPFHKFLEKIPPVISYLKKDGSAQSKQLYHQVCDLIYCLMYKHTGFPEIYEPLLVQINQDVPWPHYEQMKQKLDSSKWTSRRNYTEETDEPPMAFTSLKREKAEMGKTGLENLGNSCYMNSVIQALYMCDLFYADVLRKRPSTREGLLVKLQLLFSQMKYTKRPALAPSEFFQASRPKGFQAGHQQDCSEYLKYLLDQLHEDETRASNVDYNSEATAMDSDELLNTGLDPMMVQATKGKKENESLGRTKLPKSRIERTFRGKIHTTLRCLACKQKSSRIESFTDIPLAFPNSSRTSEYPRNNILAGGSVAPGSSKMADSMKSSKQKCLADEKCLTLNDLISFYLKPEKLVGDNKYFCDACKTLQDGEKCIEIAQSPTYLILTLMRFSYDIKQQVRTKILQDVRYPVTISLPVCDRPADDGNLPACDKLADSTDLPVRTGLANSRDNEMENSQSNGDSVLADQDELMDVTECQADAKSKDYQPPRSQLYSLCAVIVHSGSSSESGHYYCYARHSKFDPSMPLPSNRDKDILEQIDFLPDLWYNFNDSRVTATQFDSFSNVTQRFSKDTPYVLIYAKLHPTTHSVNNEPGLLQELMDQVNRDNELFHEEQKREAKLKQRRQSRNHHTYHYTPKRDSDDDDSNGGHFSLGFATDPFTSGSRFVY